MTAQINLTNKVTLRTDAPRFATVARKPLMDFWLLRPELCWVNNYSRDERSDLTFDRMSVLTQNNRENLERLFGPAPQRCRGEVIYEIWPLFAAGHKVWASNHRNKGCRFEIEVQKPIIMYGLMDEIIRKSEEFLNDAALIEAQNNVAIVLYDVLVNGHKN